MRLLGPHNLKVAVMIRVVLGAFACALAATAFVMLESNRETTRGLEAKADMISSNLEMQLLRIAANLDMQSRFPDWEFLADQALEEGLCFGFSEADGRKVRSSCVGSGRGVEVVPAWFATAYRALFGAPSALERPVVARGKTHGTVTVTIDPAVSVLRAWQDASRIVSVTVMTVLLLCGLVYVAIDRALRPANDIVAGLNRLAHGELGHRLPRFRLAELDRISEVVNHMAAELEATMSERQDYARRLVVAQEAERQRLARELHDEFGQSLAAINAIAASIETTAQSQCPEIIPEARSLAEIARKMMGELRGTLLRLRPAVVDEIGLVASLKSLVAGWNGRMGNETRFAIEAEGDFDGLPDAAAVSLYRIAQEGLTNAAKHAEARHVTLTLQRGAQTVPAAGETSSVMLTIEDDGKGYEPGDARKPGLGLSGVRERIAMFGGSLTLTGRPGGGTRLAVTLPAGLVQEAA
jgi:signal transduction histidine kinase